jgi:hypothetical protein
MTTRGISKSVEALDTHGDLLVTEHLPGALTKL